MTDGRLAGGFGSDLFIRSAGERTWMLTAPLVWTGTKGDTFTVPIGFVTDFATVPRFLHWLVSPYGAYTRAAVLHDWLLVSLANWSEDKAMAETISGTTQQLQPPANSRDTDGIFRRVMQDLGVPWSTRWVMWTGVRWGALFSPRRAYGRRIGRDMPAMLGMSLLALPVALPGTVGVLVSLGLVQLISGRPEPAPVRSPRRGSLVATSERTKTMTSPTPSPTVGDLGASLVRTFVATAVGTGIAYLARHWHIVLDGPTADGAVQAFTAVVIGVYYGAVRLLESKWAGFGWFLGLRKQPKYVDPATAARRSY